MNKRRDQQRFRLKRRVLDGPQMGRIIRRMAGQLVERAVERYGSLDPLMLVGIRTRGLPLAERLHAEIERIEGVHLPLGALDITLYRDDLSTIAANPIVHSTDLPEPVEGRVIVLCDDVLFTGRTVRAALNELADYGRPRAVGLTVLVDRGHRELPIQANIVGTTVETDLQELVEVGFVETDDEDHVHLLEPQPQSEESD